MMLIERVQADLQRRTVLESRVAREGDSTSGRPWLVVLVYRHQLLAAATVWKCTAMTWEAVIS